MISTLEKMHNDGYSLSRVAEESGTSKAMVSLYIHKRYDKIGKLARRRIYNVIVQHGWLPRRKRRPTRCRVCGVEYPTRKHKHTAPGTKERHS